VDRAHKQTILWISTMSFQKTHTNYNNGDCFHKRSCRYILQGLLEEQQIREIHSLTLPNLCFDVEHKLWNKYDHAHLNTCEINNQIFAQQVDYVNDQSFPGSNPIDKRITLHESNVFDLILDAPLNFIWLDLCGYLTSSLFKDLTRFLSNTDCRDRGVFSITLLTSRQNRLAQEFYSHLQKKYLGTYLTDLSNFRSVQFPKILKLVLEEHTRLDFSLAAKYTYKPTSGGGLMTMYSYTWTRK
jgi:hypothetical protein